MNIWFRKFESSKDKPMYYTIMRSKYRRIELVKYYAGTKTVYRNTTTLKMDHFSEFEIVEEDDPEYEELNVVLARELLVRE